MATKKILLVFCSVISLVFSNPAPSDSSGKQETTCPEGAKKDYCSGCGSYCPKPDLVCTADCREGCVCTQEGYVIGPDNKCIPLGKCPSKINTCPKGAVPSRCTGCWAYCPVSDTVCDQSCKNGCVCIRKGYVIGPDNTCIPKKQCSKVKSYDEIKKPLIKG
ncbi:IgGFc-binding protein-like [Bufo gargarizans]|uniref:IgGFc-binding protein-like n=1 Tax=Bufo gargarizans TaxID=30331 RepID=UPI001CF14C00|nr:IgGFc-binding protein-like [Bufo gargarizans]